MCLEVFPDIYRNERGPSVFDTVQVVLAEDVRGVQSSFGSPGGQTTIERRGSMKCHTRWSK
jgi:hypothetical protein